MKKMMFGALLIGALVAAPAITCAEGLSVGDTATFKMVGSDGKTYTSEQFKGKKVVVIAWYPKAFTGG